jgi:hypothetical protein
LVFSSYLIAIAPSFPQRKVRIKPGTVHPKDPINPAESRAKKSIIGKAPDVINQVRGDSIAPVVVWQQFSGLGDFLFDGPVQ